MATENPTPPEGAKDVVQQSDDSENFTLSPGEAITARLVSIQPTESEFGKSAILTLELESGEFVDLFAKDQVKKAYKQGNLKQGSTYWIGKHAETNEIDGTEYYPVDLKQI